LHGLGSGGGQRLGVDTWAAAHPDAVRASSALAVFALIFKFSPISLVAPVMTEFRGVNTYWKVLECHDRTAL